MKKLVGLLSMALSMVSCVYPFEADLGGNYGNLVVEGDIFVGSTSYFDLSYLLPLDGNGAGADFVPDATVTVECSDGTVYQAERSDENTYRVDTGSASADKDYRLHIYDARTFKNYYSSWEHSDGTCAIDDFKYRISDDREEISFLVSLHSDTGSSHFRYRYTEDWEYTAYQNATTYYIPEKTREHPYGWVGYYSSEDNIYYCWDVEESRGINLASTEGLSRDVLLDYPVMKYPKSEEKMSQVYRLTIDVYPVDEDSYAFYDHLKQMTEMSGDLFSPIPSEMRGNVICEEVPDEYVYGYVAAVCPATSQLFFIDEEDRFFVRSEHIILEPLDLPEVEWPLYHRRGYFMYGYHPMMGSLWLPAECVDCRLKGGTKNKPEGWPNNHK